MKKPIGPVEEAAWIERYWTRQLSVDEQLFFEQLMNDDTRLADEAESLRPGIEMVEEARLTANAHQTLHRLRLRHRQQRYYRIGWHTIVGVAAACVVFVVYLMLAPVGLPPLETDADVLRELRPQYRTAPTDKVSIRQKQAFDRFYEGQAALSEGQPQLAAKRFEEVLMVPGIRLYFRESAQWHLLISYLKTNQWKKADLLYSQISQIQEYEISQLERWKVWWHLRRSAWFS